MPASGSILLAPLPSRVGGRDVAVVPRTRQGVVRADELHGEHRPAPYGLPFDGWRLGEPHAVELLGAPGGGKSTLATQMAVSAARRVEVLYCAIEEGHSQSLRDRVKRAGADDLAARRLHVSDARTLAELGDDFKRVDAVLVIIEA